MQHKISEFKVVTPQSELDDLMQRLSVARLPERETVDDWTQGIPLDVVCQLLKHWQHSYDWRACEARLNSYPQFTTEIDDLNIHFLHVRSPEPKARPLLMTHGWPGSVLEFLDVIEPLTNPCAHGGKAEDAFDLVIPSLPGYGFSSKPSAAGWNIERIAEAWDVLMLRLGYTRYFAQGGDWGSMITSLIGVQNNGHCAGIHLNLVVVGAPNNEVLSNPTTQEKASLAHFAKYLKQGMAYAVIQGTRPQTLGYALADSPVGQMAWIVEKFAEWSGGRSVIETFGMDRLLDNVTLYWLTGTAASSARLYWQSFSEPAVDEVHIPTGCSLFPNEIVQPSRRWAEQRYKNIHYWNRLKNGGHFAAFEQPGVFVDEVRASFREL